MSNIDNTKNDTFLSIRNLTVEYTSENKIIHAVNNVSFELGKGRTLGLVGETGAGKTTIAKSIISVLPDPPARVKAGEIVLDGENILSLSEKELRRIRGGKVSMIFQDPMTALNPVMKVGRQIAEAIREHNNISAAEAKKRAVEMLEKVGIPGARYNEYPHQFSGGMKQRVVIAMALACSPELLLADEPTTALDVTIQAQVLEMISALKEEYDMSMILITHDLGVIADMCDDVCIIYAGQVIESGCLEDIFDRPVHPYTRGLFGSLPKVSANREKLEPIAGLMPDPTNLPQGCYFSPRCPYVTDECRSSVELTELESGHYCRCMRGKEMLYGGIT